MGTTALDAALTAPVPLAFDAVTVNVYDVPDVSPVIVHVRAVVEQVPPGTPVTV